MKLMSINIFACVTLVCAASAWSQTTQSSVEELIGKFTSPDWQARQAAEDELVNAGATAIDPINARLSDPKLDFESRERLQSALSRIGRDQLMLGTRVTINQTFSTPKEAFAALAKVISIQEELASDNAEHPANASKPVEVKLNDVAWLAALNQLIKQTDIDVRVEDTRLLVLTTPPTVVTPPSHDAGAIVIFPDNSRKRRSLDLAGENNSSTVAMRLIVATEPKIKFTDVGLRLVIRNMTDDANKAFGKQETSVPVQRERDCRYGGTLSLGSGDKLPDSISFMEGELVGELITRFDETRISDFSTLPKTVETAEGDMEVTGLKAKGKGWEVSIQLSNFGRASSMTQQLLRGQSDVLRVLDQFNRPMQVGSSKTTSNNGITVDLSIPINSPDAQATPTAIVWVIPAQTREVRIPFQLKNLKLPD